MRGLRKGFHLSAYVLYIGLPRLVGSGGIGVRDFRVWGLIRVYGRPQCFRILGFREFIQGLSPLNAAFGALQKP